LIIQQVYAVRLLTLEATEPDTKERVFSESLAGFWVGGLFALGLGAGLGSWYRFGDLPLIFAALSGGVCALVGLFFLAFAFQVSSRPRWLLAFNNHRIRIKLRSAFGRPLPREAKVVMEVPFEEIDSVALVRGVTKGTRMDGARDSSRARYLDIRLKEMDLDPVKAVLQRKPEKTSGTFVRGYRPVTIREENTIRIEWPHPLPFWYPRLARAVSELRLLIRLEEFEESEPKVEAEAESKAESGEKHAKEGEATEMDRRIRALARTGKRIQAVRLARSAYGMGLEEANEHVRRMLDEP